MQLRVPHLCAVSLFAALSLAGCSLNQDPNDYPGTWHPTAVNDYNLRLMVANPADLTRGQGSAYSRGEASATAIGRLRKDNVKDLPTENENLYTVGGAPSAPASQPASQ